MLLEARKATNLAGNLSSNAKSILLSTIVVSDKAVALNYI